MTVVIHGPDGTIRYSRPEGHPDVAEAIRTEGYYLRGPAAKLMEMLRGLPREKEYGLDVHVEGGLYTARRPEDRYTARRPEDRPMPKPHDPHGVPAVLEGGTLDGVDHLLHIPPGLEAEAWAALRRDGVPLRRRPDGGVDHLAPGGPGYYPADRVDAAGRPVLEWREGGTKPDA